MEKIKFITLKNEIAYSLFMKVRIEKSKYFYYYALTCEDTFLYKMYKYHENRIAKNYKILVNECTNIDDKFNRRNKFLDAIRFSILDTIKKLIKNTNKTSIFSDDDFDYINNVITMMIY